MPFASKKQAAKCYAMKARGEAGTWNCEEWAHKTNFKSLPTYKHGKMMSKGRPKRS